MGDLDEAPGALAAAQGAVSWTAPALTWHHAPCALLDLLAPVPTYWQPRAPNPTRWVLEVLRALQAGAVWCIFTSTCYLTRSCSLSTDTKSSSGTLKHMMEIVG